MTLEDPPHVEDENDGLVHVAVCKYLAQLPCLQDLILDLAVTDGVCLDSGDVQHLSSLTLLTNLDLESAGDLVTDAAVVVLAWHLKQLKQLSVHASSAAVVAAIGLGLKDLRTLNVLGLPTSEQRVGLQHLTGLKQLTKLQGFESCGV